MEKTQPEAMEPILGFYRERLESIVGVRGMERYVRTKKRLAAQKLTASEQPEFKQQAS